jgi:hypothetical protein
VVGIASVVTQPAVTPVFTMTYMGSVEGVFAGLLRADPSVCDAAGLANIVRGLSRVRGQLDAVEVAVTVRAAELAAKGLSPAAATVLTDGGRRSRREAETAAARGGVCAVMPELGSALADGSVSTGHVDAVVKAVARLDEGGKARLAEHAESLVQTACQSTPEQFGRHVDAVVRRMAADDGLARQERLRQQRCVRRWVDRDTGMCNTKLSLDPLADAQIWTSINAAMSAARSVDQSHDERTWDQLQADVVVELLTGARSSGDERVPEVSVLIDYRTLLEGFHGDMTCETSDGQSLPAETVRRLCCEANIVPIVLGGAGEVLDLGRHCRLANRAQRRALRAMYRTCAHPDCEVPIDACRIHHVVYWQHGGRSDLDNMVPLCERHHHLVHEGGWTLQLLPDRRTTWKTPDGEIYDASITIDRTPAKAALPRPPTVDAVAADLQDALAEIASRAPPSLELTA